LWPELLQDLNTRLVQSLWIVSLTPQSSGQGGQSALSGVSATGPTPSGGRAARSVRFIEEEVDSSGPVASAITRQGPIDEIQIEGEGNHQSDYADLALVNEFTKNLRESPFLDTNNVVIDRPPKTTGPTFAFQLRARLAKPLAF
jgi:hypothetical protein